MEKIKAYWWDGKLNLGDQLTPILLRDIFSVDAIHRSYTDADLLSTGSILTQAFSKEVRERVRPLHVVGAGLVSHEHGTPVNGGVRIHSVRGYLTASKLYSSGRFPLLPVGDPGVLVSRAVNPDHVERQYTYGVVLHYVQANNQEIRKRLSSLGNVKFLNIETDDLAGFVHEMRECEVVLSHSLHGLIIADSLGIPNVWLNLGGLVGGTYKFLDYFTTVDRPFRLRLDHLPTQREEVMSNAFYPDLDRINELQDEIMGAFAEAFAELDGGKLSLDSEEFRQTALPLIAERLKSRYPVEGQSIEDDVMRVSFQAILGPASLLFSAKTGTIHVRGDSHAAQKEIRSRIEQRGLQMAYSSEVQGFKMGQVSTEYRSVNEYVNWAADLAIESKDDVFLA
ncbi:polysaccharide pyruvyl transferase family protein [Corynebacterium afermentans]|uniref:polysaccharide pyruvyl transferase family protein n=1 Tax=Corynebacterium afermentans TaxID=38286 RepID=UPI002573BFF8|nr:polysaccharide pyruvyl transferase family protein [Corynebacterium afermentans]